MRVRKRWAVLGVSVALVGVLAYFVIDLMWATPAPRFNAAERMDALVQGVQPAGENSWPAYRAVLRGETPGAGVSSMPLPSSGERDLAWPSHPASVGAWEDARHDPWRKHLADSALHMEEFIEATALPGFRRVLTSEFESLDAPLDIDPSVMPAQSLFEGIWTHLGPQRSFTRLLVAAMRSAVAAGEWNEFIRYARAGIRSGVHNTLQGIALEWLVGFSQLTLVLSEVRLQLAEREVPADVCAALLGAIRDAEALLPPSTHLVEVERALIQDATQWAFDRKGRLVSWTISRSMFDLDDPPTFGERALNLLSPLHPGYEATAATVDAYFDEAAKQARGELADQAAVGERVDANPVAYILMPAMFRVLRNTMYYRQQIAGTRVMLHLEIYHAEHGRWPDALAEAMPVEETICPGGDVAFEYVVRDDGYDLFIPESAPSRRADGWESDDERCLTIGREPFPEGE
ncbi:MAG: hypothetical protein ACF8QF_00720 [Phycisphaerales bacterium]